MTFLNKTLPRVIQANITECQLCRSMSLIVYASHYKCDNHVIVRHNVGLFNSAGCLRRHKTTIISSSLTRGQSFFNLLSYDTHSLLVSPISFWDNTACVYNK